MKASGFPCGRSGSTIPSITPPTAMTVPRRSASASSAAAPGGPARGGREQCHGGHLPGARRGAGAAVGDGLRPFHDGFEMLACDPPWLMPNATAQACGAWVRRGIDHALEHRCSLLLEGGSVIRSPSPRPSTGSPRLDTGSRSWGWPPCIGTVCWRFWAGSCAPGGGLCRGGRSDPWCGGRRGQG